MAILFVEYLFILLFIPFLGLLANNVLPRSAMIANTEKNISTPILWCLMSFKVVLERKAETNTLIVWETLLHSCCTREQLRHTAVHFLICVNWHCAVYCEWQHRWHMMYHTWKKSLGLLFMPVNHVKLSTYFYLLNDMPVLLIVSKLCSNVSNYH